MIEILFVASSTAPASAKMSRLRRGATHHPAAAIRRRRCLENLRPTELLRAAAKPLGNLWPAELLGPTAKSFG
jgi:hypothetical protein